MSDIAWMNILDLTKLARIALIPQMAMKRQDMKQIDLQKKTVEYQKMINKNRTAFGLKEEITE